jgi:hypothetical protein
MAKDPKPPISPTVEAVFGSFVEKLQSSGTDSSVVEKLRKSLEAQELDAESLRAALFGSAPKTQ